MRSERRVIILLSLLAGLAAVVVWLAAGQRARPGVRYFAETRHTIREPFLATFDAHGGPTLFGFPLTEAYTTEDGTRVQTFQRAQLHLTPRGVELAPIGLALHLGEPASGLEVAGAFKPFYQQSGGESFFGAPLNAAREENGLLVQDFERARIMRDALGEVRLANLGSIYLAAFPLPESAGQAAIRLHGTPTPPPEIQARVSIANPTVVQGGEQTIYLYVADANGQPVAGARALAILRYDGATAEVELSHSDASGLASARFIVPPAAPGSQILVEVHVLIGETLLNVETAYFQWW